MCDSYASILRLINQRFSSVLTSSGKQVDYLNEMCLTRLRRSVKPIPYIHQHALEFLFKICLVESHV